MIVFNNVTLKYPYDEFEVLKDVSFTIHNGVNTVLADAQSGKSSICKLLLKDIAPTSGQIFVDEQAISSITNANLDILYLPRKPIFFERKSVQYNVEYPLKIRKVGKMERQAIACDMANKFGLKLDTKVCKLNQVERRALALARGLTVKRSVALFDGFFDDDTLNLEYVNSILQHFDTCVVLTHDTRLAMGHTVVLDGGTVVHEGDALEAQQVVSQLHWLTQLC